MASAIGGQTATAPGFGEASARFGPILAAWMALTIALEGALWAAGARPTGLAVAVDRGAARAESWGIGEVADDAVRKAIKLQRDTLPFWTTLAELTDFAAEPMALALRAVLVATALSSLAALTGRPTRFGQGLAECAALQGFWVLGLAVRVGMLVALRRPDAETSAVLLLPPGTWPAPLWAALRQLDAFAMLGWIALARGGWRRGQANLATSAAVCAILWGVESALRVAGTLVFEAGMRLTLIPDWVAN